MINKNDNCGFICKYLRRETTALYKYFQEEVGPVVDMNLDSFPDYIVVTFVNHKDVVKTLEKASELFKFQLQSSKETKYWSLQASKIDFTCHVRNCPRGDESAPNKYLPLFVQTERLVKAKEALLGSVVVPQSIATPILAQQPSGHVSSHSSGEGHHRTVSLTPSFQ
ncbi:hypothetical protein FGO68_gene6960 [Halteria grandinella]|uniref:Uncharacterized protein n=1 Tax=Halteria grandinella TaxID=5974 RepID=A0A8J8T8A3_HALGN|nr:hypothetical protein FGO68_gene6960 [Halteria grandinella]